MSSELMTSSSLFIVWLEILFILTWFALYSAFVPVLRCFLHIIYWFFSSLFYNGIANNWIYIIVFISISIWCTELICISNVNIFFCIVFCRSDTVEMRHRSFFHLFFLEHSLCFTRNSVIPIRCKQAEYACLNTHVLIVLNFCLSLGYRLVESVEQLKLFACHFSQTFKSCILMFCP